MASPAGVQSQIKELRRPNVGSGKQMIIWEPARLFCFPEHLDSCFQSARMVDVFSPNHVELLAFFGVTTEPFDTIVVESLATAPS